MLRRLWTSLKRDHRINLRNHFYTVTVAVAVIYLALVWALPESASIKPTTFLVDLTPDQRVAAAVQAPEAEAPVAVLQDPAEISRQMQENANSVGILVQGGEPLPQVTLYFQGHHNQRIRNLLAVATADLVRELYGQAQTGSAPVRYETLGATGPGSKPPLGKLLLPFLLFSDPAMIGVAFVAALIFMEKEEGTLKAYLVTPGRVYEYLLSKALSLSALAVIFTLLLAPAVVGLTPNYLHLLALMLVAGLFSSLLGAAVAVYFQNFSQFLYVAVGLMLLISLPGVAYFVPSFSPAWIRWLPTYPLIFGLREAVFPSGNPQIVYSALATLLAYSLGLLGLGSLTFGRQMSRS